MRKIYTLLVALCSIGTWAQPSLDAQAMAVQERDRALNELIVRHQVGAAQDYYDDLFVLTTAAGSMKSKEMILAEISSPGLTLDVNETTDVVVRVRGNTAVLTGVLRQRGAYKGKPFDARLRVTDTWHLTNGQWKILAGHASPL